MNLFSVFQAKLNAASVRYDMHCHLLPNVDDGAATQEDMLRCIHGLLALRYSGAILTPHIYADVFRNTEASLRGQFEKMSAAAHEMFPEFHLRLAAEYFLDAQMVDYFRERVHELLYLNQHGRMLLFELPKYDLPVYFERFINQCCDLNITPVLAHVERYAFIQNMNDLNVCRDWREAGVKLQVNLGSFVGQYGPKAAHIARKLLRAGLIDLVGSDLHKQEHLEVIRDAWQWLGRHAGDAFNYDLQQRLMNNEPVYEKCNIAPSRSPGEHEMNRR